MELIEILMLLVGTNTVVVIFGAGALWQRVRSNGQRLDRIEALLNGHLLKLDDHDSE
jgi:hypothetical protein